MVLDEIKGVLCEGVNDEESEFSRLLRELVEKRPDLIKLRTKGSLLHKSVKSLYSKLSKLTLKPLTKHEIIYVINELEIRRTRFLNERATSNISCDIENLDFCIKMQENVIISTEQIPDHRLVRLMEKLNAQISSISPHKSPMWYSVNVLIRD